MKERRYEWLLRLLPGPFREDHGAEMLRVWRDELRDADAQHGRRLWWRALMDTLNVAPREHLSTWRRNVSLAVRRLRRSPVFTLTAVVTLGLATGLTGAVYSVVNAVLLRPLPWRTPETVGLIWAVQPSGARTWLSFPELEDLQRETTSFTAVAGFTDLRPTLVADGVGQELQALAVSHGFFRLLGVSPRLGRDFDREEDHTGAAPVAMLSHAFWRRQFAADPAVVGRSLTLDGRVYSVIGVLPEGFAVLPASSVLPDRVDVWMPLEPHLRSRDRSVRFLHAVARLRPDVSFAGARDELHAYALRVRGALAASYPDERWDFAIVSFAEDVLATARVLLYLLFALGVLVLAMGCANVASLLLVRGEARRRELAIRTALGASTARLAAEVLAEAVVLAAGGNAIGLLLAAGGPLVLRAIDPAAFPRLDEARVDRHVIGFMFGLSVVSVALFGCLPLLERLRRAPPGLPTIKRGDGRSPRSVRLGGTLVIVQTGLATTIVITTLLLNNTFLGLQDAELGIRPHRVLTGRLSLSSDYPPGPAAARFFDLVMAAADATPGVVQAAGITQLPLSGAMLASTFSVESAGGSRRIDADLRGITPHYFEVIGTPMLQGRPFGVQDAAAAPPVAIIDDTFARRLRPDGNVLGARIRWIRQPDVELEVVGIVTAVRHRGPSEAPRDTVYRPHQQYARASMFVAVKTEGDAVPGTLLRGIVASIDPAQPLADVATMDERFGRSLGRLHTSLMLSSVLTIVALTLAGTGLYGVLSFGVAQRGREFGVRAALGAEPAALRRTVMREGLRLTVTGTCFGAGAAAILAPAAGTTLDTANVAVVWSYSLGLLAVFVPSTLAFWLPARRAAGADPSIVLRGE